MGTAAAGAAKQQAIERGGTWEAECLDDLIVNRSFGNLPAMPSVFPDCSCRSDPEIPTRKRRGLLTSVPSGPRNCRCWGEALKGQPAALPCRREPGRLKRFRLRSSFVCTSCRLRQ
jgi:hypothetical protein